MADPTEFILQMRQQGLNNNQIVQNLQRQGYKSHEIFDAMNQVEMQSGAPIQNAGPQQQGRVGREIQMPPPGPPPAMPPPMQQTSMDESGEGGSDTDKIEEIAEAIIEEKWEELIKNVNKIVEWKDKTESRLSKIETNFEHLKDNFDQLHQGVLGKITEYEKGITELGTEIKALEKVFQKILPTLTENVNELSRITSKIKGSDSAVKKK